MRRASGAPVRSPPVTPDTRLRWGLGAFWIAWFASLVSGVVGGALAIAVLGSDVATDDPGILIASLVAQAAGAVVAVAVVSATRGQHGLRADFGLEVRWRDAPWLLVGIALQIAVAIVLIPLTLLEPDQAQQVVESFEETRGSGALVLFAFTVVVLAPLSEELLFRGVLLRALLRRTSPGSAVLWSSAIFAAVHVLLDPSVGSGLALPALMLLGLVSGDQAVRTRSLSRSMMLHAGFNFLTALRILTL